MNRCSLLWSQLSSYVSLIMNMGWGCFIDCAIFTVPCSFFMLYLLLIPHDLYVYIVVDTSLYSYTLPIDMYLDIILTLSFQPLLPGFKLIISCHVMCHVIMVTCLFIIQKIKIKSRKIDKKKRLKLKHTMTGDIIHYNSCRLTYIRNFTEFSYINQYKVPLLS